MVLTASALYPSAGSWLRLARWFGCCDCRSAQGSRRIGNFRSRGASTEIFNLLQSCDVPARTSRGTIQRGRRATEFKYFFRLPPAHQSEQKRAVKNVARAGGIRGANAKSGAKQKLLTIPDQRTHLSECRPHHAALEPPTNLRERFQQILLGS